MLLLLLHINLYVFLRFLSSLFFPLGRMKLACLAMLGKEITKIIGALCQLFMYEYDTTYLLQFKVDIVP